MSECFELTVLARVGEDQEELLEDIENLINENSEAVDVFEDDGEKRLAYDIEDQNVAHYYFWQMFGVRDKGQAIEEELAKDERILRHLLVTTIKRKESR